jgi:uncharacterized protein (UPF0335 family)
MLAERLSRRGLTLSAGTLAMAISEAAAAVPPGLAGATAQNAVLVAAGRLAAISSSVTALMKIGAKAMFLAKLKAAVATLMVVAVLGGGLVYSGSGGGQAKPQNELEALRRENELLKVNLRVTLEKIESLEKQVKDLKGDTAKRTYGDRIRSGERISEGQALAEIVTVRKAAQAALAEQARAAAAVLAERVAAARSAAEVQQKKADAAVEAAHAALGEQKRASQSQQQLRYHRAVQALQNLQANENSKNARQRALDALEKAIKELRELEQKSNK